MARMAREHMPIQIGLPAEPAWEVAEPAPITYIAYVAGDEVPDPGAAFIAAGESFGVAPQDTEPVPVEDDDVAWAFAFALPSRAARVMVWCERVADDARPDGGARDAKWVLFVETLLEASRAADDAVALAATACRAGGARTRLLLDPGLGMVWNRADIERLFLSEPNGALVDQRILYRIELAAKDRERGPFWITTVGLARIARPELELLEVPRESLRSALELVDALAARFFDEDVPHAGVPFEAGLGLRLALVPAAEASETVPADAPGGVQDRRRMPSHPRAAICAAGKRGSFRQVWVPPTEELALLSRNELGVFLSPRVSVVRERMAQLTWTAFVRAHAAGSTPQGDAVPSFLAKIALGDTVGERAHLWIAVSRADADGGEGVLDRPDGSREAVAFRREQIGDWRIVGLRPDLPEVGPEGASVLD
ncbi:MAG: hypothetical protein RLZZ116_2248 [Planctomycetota bacterium]|jgi:hypothetical protein